MRLFRGRRKKNRQQDLRDGFLVGWRLAGLQLAVAVQPRKEHVDAEERERRDD
jgi:hypothetical protein